MLSFAVVMLVWKTGNVQKIKNASGLQLTLVTVCTADKFSCNLFYIKICTGVFYTVMILDKTRGMLQLRKIIFLHCPPCF